MKFEFEVHIHHSAGSADVESIRLDLAELITMGNAIMNEISTSVAAQKEAYARLDASLTGISGDITALAAKIAELQASPGTVTPEDQALLDQATALAKGLADRFEAVDALTEAAPTV